MSYLGIIEQMATPPAEGHDVVQVPVVGIGCKAANPAGAIALLPDLRAREVLMRSSL
jgi:hypothetical protein